MLYGIVKYTFEKKSCFIVPISSLYRPISTGTLNSMLDRNKKNSLAIQYFHLDSLSPYTYHGIGNYHWPLDSTAKQQTCRKVLKQVSFINSTRNSDVSTF